MQERYPRSVLEGAVRGEEQALGSLLALAQVDLRRFARRSCLISDVEDAVQESLWILYRKVGGIRTLETLAGWLATVVKRECQRLARRALRLKSLEEEESGWEDRWARAPDEALRLDLARALGSLGADQREILLLCDLQGWTAQEAAEILGVSLPAAKSRLLRARAALRALLRP